MGKGGGGGVTTTENEIPEELKPLINATVGRWLSFQNQAWENMFPGMEDPGLAYGGFGTTPDPPSTGGGGRPGDPIPGDNKSTPLDPKEGTVSSTYNPDQGMATPPFGSPIGANSGSDDPPSLYDPNQGQGQPPPGSPIGANSGSDGLPSAWWLPSDGGWSPPADGLFGDGTRYIAGPSPLEDIAASYAKAIGVEPKDLGTARGLFDQMGEVSQRKVTGEGLQEDPAFLATQAAFNDTLMPLIENQAALSGLGRSTSMNAATGAQQAQYMLPAIQDFMSREERGIDRELSTLGGRASGYTGLGDRQTGRMQTAIDNLMNIGGIGRGIAQDRSDASYNEWLRKMGLFESAMGGPFGVVPSTIGTKVTSDPNKK